MKLVKYSLMFLACAAALPALAQSSPQCGSTNFDRSRDVFTIVNPAAGAVNQQCFITVVPAGTAPDRSRSTIAEGSYVVELSGGGGGGGGGAMKDAGGGGGGAGAAPSRSVKYLAPGEYKLTMGTGGEGGSANGGRTKGGNPTSLTKAGTGELVAGFQGADVWTQQSVAATDGRGGIASAGGSSGGNGGDSGPRSEEAAQAGGMLQTSGYSGKPGNAGTESGRTANTDAGRVTQSDAGGGGGASVGNGGSGESAGSAAGAGMGDLGGGGGGGRGGVEIAEAGGRGGHGFIKLALQTPAVAAAPAPVVVERQAAPVQTVMAPEPVARSEARPARKDRN
jgi:hypothetical protein